MKPFSETLAQLSNAGGRAALLGMQRGIERETLRIDADNQLAMDPHPAALGAALTNSRITTDYSEALLEFITPVCGDIDEMLKGLTETHAFALRHLNDQKLWPVSMPCYVGDERKIPIAYYGTSNNGKMKRLYRKGLTYRYGALMQIIAGVHFNFSVSDELWQLLYEQSDKHLTLCDFKSERYFGLIRNYRRLVWVLPYLFGASPALCGSFIKGQKTELAFEKMGQGTLFLPYATSLRMSDLGYTNKEQEKLSISYNSLTEYLDGIRAAIKMPSQKFANIGVKVDGEYRQLNANILQIENEFYAPIRAKRVAHDGEKPSEALARAGVEYIEVRALDVNPFSPVGVEASQLRLLDLFLLYCLLSPSAVTDDAGEKEVAANLKAVVLEGRKPDLMLQRDGKAISRHQWLQALFAKLSMLAELLDGNDTYQYREALAFWQQAVEDPNKTLSGRVLSRLTESGQSHGAWVKALAEQYRQQLLDYPLSTASIASFEAEAAASIAKQQQQEQEDTLNFDDFLAQYFNTTTAKDVQFT
ncbi:glutamate--cysteine ligase [Shewanella yunxiaonensis]|uniref:Glutamate--cysteine ligase n=1 Tax=Shewanella yunxiaonensis TaxID=2829809 RepID=A0ABX7YPY8_9GAMM|nr:glutamate--cysteine ligase [Shewanella yunxiaonensis]QUN04818.1 glutamate--cysteine ligase [Shewanella yunxiaonensis]